MTTGETLRLLGLNDAEVKSRRVYFELTDEDLRRLSALRPIVEPHADRIISDLYELILAHPQARAVFRDEASLRRAQRAQREYFLGLFGGRCDLAYVEDRLRIGLTHERIGVAPKWYLGAYARYMRALLRLLLLELVEAKEAVMAYQSVEKLVAFDMALAMDTYIAAQLETVERQRQAIRELSTPILQLDERVLLLPLVGALDTERAEQANEAALDRVSRDRARVLILDISGVSTVDTAVAANLVRCAQAVHLLGAETILSGLSASVAMTLVHLGVELGALHTCGQLSQALVMARALVARATPSAEVLAKLEAGAHLDGLSPGGEWVSSGR